MSEKASGNRATVDADGVGGSIQQLMTDPSAVSALSEKIAQFINAKKQPDIPPAVQRRINALKNLQVEVLKVESEFYREVQLLEAKYMKQYQPLLDKRHHIVSGGYEPSDTECQWAEEEGSEDKEEGKEGKKEGGGEEEVKGIPDFWLTALKNTDVFADMIKEHDEPVLKKLMDIKVVYPNHSGMDFQLVFHFSPNEWFSNAVLTKTYHMSCEVEEEEPFSFEGAAITACEGCKIDWKKGRNLTVKTIKKKQKHKGHGQARMVTKTVPNESFFTFFSPPKMEGGEEQGEEEEVSQLLSDDYARAEFVRDRLVPKGVLFFTGEIMEEDDFEMDEDEEEEEEEDEEEEGEYSAKDQVESSKPNCPQQ